MTRDELIANAVHELKNPLAAITGYAELLLTRDDERTRREAPVAIAAAARLLHDRIDSVLAELVAEVEANAP